MAKAKTKTEKRIVIPKSDLITPNIPAWCGCGPGYLQCLTCGSKIRVGGTMVDKDGNERRRTWTPWRWWNKHSMCEREK